MGATVMNTDRLLRLAAHLETVPESEFDMRTWAKQTPCGTVCCAVGHAASIPEFRDAGLSLMPVMDNPIRLVPFYDGLSDWDATMRFFDLRYREACHLFDPTKYSEPLTPRAVAARLRMVAGGRP